MSHVNINIKIFNQRHSLRELWVLRKNIINTLISYKKIINLALLCVCIIFKINRSKNSPFYLMVETTSICNLSCPMCPRQLASINRKNNLIDYGLFQKLMEETGSKLMFLLLWNFGEPFLNPELFKMIRLAKKYHVFVGISTNGILLTKGNIYKLLDSGLDYLIISLDGADENTYIKYRKGGNFYTVVNNIKELIRARSREHLAKPFVNLQCIIFKDTAYQMNDYIALGKNLGVDKISFKKIHYSHLINKDMLPSEKRYTRERKSEAFCSRPFLGAVVLSDGDVGVCCNDLEAKHIIENIKNLSFLSIWNSKEFRFFRDSITKNFKNVDICQTCYSGNFNESFYNVMQQKTASLREKEI